MFGNPIKKRGVKKSKPDLVKKLDKIFSRYIRLRDAYDNGYFRCISCGKIKPVDQADCGHFYGREHMATRFDEDNCHAECRACNRMSSDHIIGYYRNLEKMIGKEGMDRLDVRRHSIKRWSDFELEELIKHYNSEVARLQKEKGIKI